jgi:ABC-type branched-subunit amino acid transport system substrate-binding protein
MSAARYRMLAVPLVLALLVVACGQKPGVHVDSGPLAGGESGQADDGMGETSAAPADEEFDVDLDAEDGADGPTAGDTGGGDTDSSDGNGASASGGGSGGGDGGESDGNGGGDGGGSGDGGGNDDGGTREPQGSDRTGVTDDKITVAVHAPVTGAAPLPSTSFEQAGDLYWRWLMDEQGGDVLGRTEVEAIFADDRYEPSAARQVCRQLADRAFIVTGGGGTDQIQACGQLAAQIQVPYFSAGVTEAGLEDNPWYFASSMTYRQQGGLLAEMVADRFGDAKTAAIITQTPNFDDAVSGWEQGVQEQGVDYHQTLRHPRGDTSWYSGFANQLGDAGVEVVYILTTPLDYIRFAQVSEDQGHDFQFVGVGVSMGLNAVLGSGCPSVDGGIFFSPFPSLDVIDDLDPDFNRAAEKFGTPNDDLALAIWGASKSLHMMLDRYGETFGNDLTREDFRALVEGSGRLESGIFPPVEYTPDNHFGGQAVHVLEADCSVERHRDGGTFVTGF